MQESYIVKQLYLSSKLVYSGYKDRLLENLRENLPALTTKTSGIVCNISDIDVKFGIINEDGDLHSTVKIYGTLFKPEKGIEIKAIVIKSLQIGVLLSFLGINIWVKKEDTHGIVCNPGDQIDIIIKIVRYENGLFTCIAEIKKEDSDSEALADE